MPKKTKKILTVEKISDDEQRRREEEEIDVYLHVEVHNATMASLVDPFKYQLKVSVDGLRSSSWYVDMVNVSKLIKHLGATPRDFFMSQVREYYKPYFLGRRVPTVRMMASQKAVVRYEEYMLKKKIYKAPVTVSKSDLINFSKDKMQSLMSKYNITASEFLRDPVLVSLLSPDFLKENKEFNSLLQSNYYETVYGIPNSYLFS